MWTCKSIKCLSKFSKTISVRILIQSLKHYLQSSSDKYCLQSTSFEGSQYPKWPDEFLIGQNRSYSTPDWPPGRGSDIWSMSRLIVPLYPFATPIATFYFGKNLSKVYCVIIMEIIKNFAYSEFYRQKQEIKERCYFEVKGKRYVTLTQLPCLTILDS